MSTLNWNVKGDPKGDQPRVSSDNPPGGHQLDSHFEGVHGELPNRFVVTVPPSFTGGASLFYKVNGQEKEIRVILPPGPGSYEADAPPCRPPEYGPEVDMALDYGIAAPVHPTLHGIVRFIGRAWTDDDGPYYPLGDTMLYALGHWHRGGAKRDLVEENVSYIAAAGHDYVRILGGVNWSNDQDINPNWSEYVDDLSGLLDFIWSRGLRTKITVTGGGVDIRTASDKIKRVVGAGRHHMIQVIESVNEQNDSGANAILVAQSLRELGVPVSTGRGNAGIDVIRNEGSAAGASTDIFHTERGLGSNSEPGGPHARQVRQCWDFKEFNRSVEDGEPPGLTSSVATLDDPFQIAMKRFSSIVCGAGAYCAHTGHGVYGTNYQSPYGFRYAHFNQAPGMNEMMLAVRNADTHLPKGVENWQKFNGGYGGPLIVDVSSGQVNKIYGARNGGAFVQTIIGANGQLELKAKQPCNLKVVNPATGEVLFEGHVAAEGRVVGLAPLWGFGLIGSIG